MSRRRGVFAVLACVWPWWVLAQEPDHAQMDHAQHAAPSQSSSAQVPRTPIPVVTDADRRAAMPPSEAHGVDDNAIHSYSLLNRLEGWDADPGTGLAWEGQGWIGRDIDRLWWRTEGERVDGETEAANIEALYGRAFSPWWDWVVGVRQDFKPGADRTSAVFGVQGLAPQRFEVSLTGYVGSGRQTAIRFETEYELLFTNRLILQPLLDVTVYGKSDAARGIGSGLSTAEAGLRLRYEFTRRFAPYVGVVHERAFGKTADLRRAAAADVSDVRIVAGLRMWF